MQIPLKRLNVISIHIMADNVQLSQECNEHLIWYTGEHELSCFLFISAQNLSSTF